MLAARQVFLRLVGQAILAEAGALTLGCEARVFALGRGGCLHIFPMQPLTYWAGILAGLLYEWLQAVVLLMQCYLASQGHVRDLTDDHQMGTATSDDMHVNPKARPPVPVTPSPKATPKQRASPQEASTQRAVTTTSSSSTQPPPLGDMVNPKAGQEKIGSSEPRMIKARAKGAHLFPHPHQMPMSRVGCYHPRLQRTGCLAGRGYRCLTCNAHLFRFEESGRLTFHDPIEE